VEAEAVGLHDDPELAEVEVDAAAVEMNLRLRSWKPRPARDGHEALLELGLGADVGVAVEELSQWPDAGLRAECLECGAQLLGVDEVLVRCLVDGAFVLLAVQA
jgi:hypothetical protein